MTNLLNAENRPSLVRLPLNTHGRDWFVGDLHGKLSMLGRALTAAMFDPSVDRLISVGDLVDRGPQSLEMLQLFRKEPWAYSVLGNHEVMALRRLQGITKGYVSQEIWLQFIPVEERREALDYLLNVPIALEVPLADGRRCGVIHAELPPDADWTIVEQARLSDDDFHDPDERKLIACLLWARRRCYAAQRVRFDPRAKSVATEDRWRTQRLLEPTPGMDLVVAGHSVLERPYEPLSVANYLWIDTGCGYSTGRLSLVNPVEDCYLQVYEGKARLKKLTAPLDLSGYQLQPAMKEQFETRMIQAGHMEDFVYGRPEW